MANYLPATASESIGDSVQAIEAVHAQTIQRLLDGENAADRRLIQWSDWCSPILVKETRQALKSRQFIWTFLLLIAAIVCWTFFAVISSMPGIYFFPAGKTLLIGYLALLIVPTIVIVPNAAYHSMATELDQGTFDVLSISPLTPMKIVSGKLAVAMVQSLIYFSALAPCIALTYLLRGVPIFTIGLTLGWVALMSLVVSSLGILLAAVNRIGALSTLLSIVLILVALGSSIILFASLWGLIESQFAISLEQLTFMLLTMAIIATYSWLMILAAAAAIGIAGENYATAIRWWVLLQSMLIAIVFIGSITYYASRLGTNLVDKEAFIALLFLLATHWAVVGTFFVGESGVTSPRAQRTLPDTLLARVFLTWTNPGSGPGYFFVLGSFAAVVMTIILNATGVQWSRGGLPEVAGYGLTLLMHLTIFLGLTRLLVLLIAQNMNARMIVSLCIMVVLLSGTSLLTVLISYLANGMNEPTFEWYSTLNIFWTYYEINSDPFGPFIVLLWMAIVVFAINLVSLTRDITLVRIQAPERVLKERHGNLPAHNPPAEFNPLAPDS
ncbi:MAG: hypothetical protein SGI77_18960 [Pirellulaceae bacterium]|nr:hypothetical protein [Pirellulaceae bacterium]